MSERKTEMLSMLDTADVETRAILNGLSDDDLKKRTDESNWTVGQLAGHIAQVPWAIYVTRRLSQGRNAAAPAPFGFLLNLGNWWNVRRFRNASKRQLLDSWSKGLSAYRSYVESLPDEVLDKTGEVSGLGRMSVYEFVKRAPEHTREHGATIQRALSAETELSKRGLR